MDSKKFLLVALIVTAILLSVTSGLVSVSKVVESNTGASLHIVSDGNPMPLNVVKNYPPIGKGDYITAKKHMSDDVEK